MNEFPVAVLGVILISVIAPTVLSIRLTSRWKNNWRAGLVVSVLISALSLPLAVAYGHVLYFLFGDIDFSREDTWVFGLYFGLPVAVIVGAMRGMARAEVNKAEEELEVRRARL
jgi:hypothetical protein